MKKLLLILTLAVSANAGLDMWDAKTLRSIESNTASTNATLNRIAAAIERQNQLLEKLVQQNTPPAPPPKPVVVENPSSTPAPKYDKYNRDKMFIRPGEQPNGNTTEEEACIKECAEIYETTDKLELKDCLMEMCGFSVLDIYK